MRIIPVSLILLPVLLCAAPQPRIWVLHDLAKINPQTGDAYEAQALYKTKLPENYRDKNAVWDATSRTITLAMLRDEVAAFQIVVESEKSLSVDSVRCSDLSGPGLIAARERITVAREWFMEVTIPSTSGSHYLFSYGKGWYPHPLIPADDPDLKPEFRWPARLPDLQNKIPGQKALVFWVDVHVPKAAAPGLYKGTVTVWLDGKPQTLSLAVTAGKEIIPPENHSSFLGTVRAIRQMYNYYPGQVKAMNFLFHSHRLDLDPYMYYLKIDGKGRDVKIRWDTLVTAAEDKDGFINFETQILPYLRPETYTAKNGYNGPAENTAPGWLSLPFQTNWMKAAGVKYGDPDYATVFLALCKQVAEKLNSYNITQRRTCYINSADEPKDSVKLNIGKEHALLLDRANRDYGLKCLYRMDIGGIGRWMARMVPTLTTGDSLLNYFKNTVAVWNINPGLNSFQPGNNESVDAFRKRHPGVQFWMYATNTSGEPAIGNNILDGENLGVITWPWAFYRYRVEGGMFWEAFGWCTPGSPNSVTQLWTVPLPDSKPNPWGLLNGDLAAAYPGEFVLVKPSPLPSMKLKLMRRANQDYEYLWLLEKKKGRAASDSIVASVLPKALWDTDIDFGEGGWKKHKEGTLHPEDPGFNYMKGQWSHNPEDWVAARMKAFEAINR